MLFILSGHQVNKINDLMNYDIDSLLDVAITQGQVTIQDVASVWYNSYM